MKSSLIQQVPLFATLPPAELDALAASLDEHLYPASTLLFREGDYGDRFYVVLDGEIAIVKEQGSADERLLALRGQGEFVGEMSLLNGDGRRTATALVHTDARLLELSRADFDRLLHRFPGMAYQMLQVISTRLRASHDAAIHDLQEKNRILAQAYADLKAAQAKIIEQETLARELRLATGIQMSMLPRKLPRLPDVDLGALMLPARSVGGDFYDAIALDADRVALAIGDVSGKGVPAALFMALTCSLLRAEASRVDSPREVLLNVNRQLLGMNAKGMFVTLLYAVFDRRTRTLDMVRAGHELPLVWRADGTFVEVPRSNGHPLGLFPVPALDVQRMEVPAGGTVLLFTDGVTEATDAQDEFYGLERLRSAAQATQGLGAQQLCDGLLQVLAAFHDSVPQADDITMVALRSVEGATDASSR